MLTKRRDLLEKRASEVSVSVVCTSVCASVCDARRQRDGRHSLTHTSNTYTHTNIQQEVEKVKEIKKKPGTEERKKKDALMCMKRKKMLTDGADQLDRMIMNIGMQVMCVSVVCVSACVCACVYLCVCVCVRVCCVYTHTHKRRTRWILMYVASIYMRVFALRAVGFFGRGSHKAF
jgi:hypothetical protein